MIAAYGPGADSCLDNGDYLCENENGTVTCVTFDSVPESYCVNFFTYKNCSECADNTTYFVCHQFNKTNNLPVYHNSTLHTEVCGLVNDCKEFLNDTSYNSVQGYGCDVDCCIGFSIDYLKNNNKYISGTQPWPNDLEDKLFCPDIATDTYLTAISFNPTFGFQYIRQQIAQFFVNYAWLVGYEYDFAAYCIHDSDLTYANAAFSFINSTCRYRWTAAMNATAMAYTGNLTLLNSILAC